MDKKDALQIIIRCAKEYSNNLENKHILFLYSDKNKCTHFFEAVFLPRHFQHFTGTKYNRKIIGSSIDFYNLCLKNRLSLDGFEMSKDGTTQMKLQALPALMRIHKTSKMIGDYNGMKPKIYIEKVSGGVTSCMGFVKEGNFYSPNTVIKQDIREITTETMRVIAVFTKNIENKLYECITYTAKGIDYKNLILPRELKDKIDNQNLNTDF